MELFHSQSLSATLLLHSPLYGDDEKRRKKGTAEIFWDLDVYYFFIMKKLTSVNDEAVQMFSS